MENQTTIIIPTCKSREAIQPLLNELETVREKVEVHAIVATCLKASAAVNRNYGLSKAKTERIIMIDDDMTGFYSGWELDLTEPLLTNEKCKLVTARLLNPDKSMGIMMSFEHKYNMTDDYITLSENYAPTAAIAFDKGNLSFDINFIGSGFEDTDFCDEINAQNPGCQFVLANKCKLIHKNEQKHQRGYIWEQNKAYYVQKKRLRGAHVAA